MKTAYRTSVPVQPSGQRQAIVRVELALEHDHAGSLSQASMSRRAKRSMTVVAQHEVHRNITGVL